MSLFSLFLHVQSILLVAAVEKPSDGFLLFFQFIDCNYVAPVREDELCEELRVPFPRIN